MFYELCCRDLGKESDEKIRNWVAIDVTKMWCKCTGFPEALLPKWEAWQKSPAQKEKA